MADDDMRDTRIPGWCALCRSRCGCISVVRDGRLVRIERDPSHPTGRALCAKGQAAPEQVESPDRILHPMKRTRPKGDPDPGWVRISWDEALDTVAAEMRRLAGTSGPESVAFAITTPSGTAISDSVQWVERLMHAFGSPNNCYGTEICNWHKDVATTYTYGTSIGTPDWEHTGCALLWGHNPGTSWIAQARQVADARARGAKLVVIDPRRAGAANKADLWLRVRPGTDGALALGIARVVLEEGWYDRGFVRDLTNAPYLVHQAESRLLRESDLVAGGAPDRYVVWNTLAERAEIAPRAPVHSAPWALEGEVTVATREGPVRCRPVLDAYRALCAPFAGDALEAVTGVHSVDVRAAAEMLTHSGPVAYYAWSGVGQHTNATQTDRAISCLYALTGSLGRRGGNVELAKVPTADVSGRELVTDAQRAKTLGFGRRPLGPPKDGWCTSEDLYRAIATGQPYPVRGLLTFGANLLVSHAGTAAGAQALEGLDFHVHADIFPNPTAEYADILLPVNTAWEREALRVGFEITQAANGRVQLRPPVVASRGESRDDGWIAFALAERLGLGNRFWNGDRDAGYREWLAPSGIGLDTLRARPEGVDVELETPYAGRERDGFPTPSGRIEIWSETFRTHGYPALPAFEPPAIGPRARPDLTRRYPLVLTTAKPHMYCHGQHRNLPRLRKLQPHPGVEMHPDTAAARAIADGDWVEIETPDGRVHARASLKPALAPDVVAAQHGWWQACRELDLPGYPVLGEATANLNAAVGAGHADPISGSLPLRSYLCEVRRSGRTASGA